MACFFLLVLYCSQYNKYLNASIMFTSERKAMYRSAKVYTVYILYIKNEEAAPLIIQLTVIIPDDLQLYCLTGRFFSLAAG